jgi:uncharacterized protein YqgC (DUF456 family)
MLHWLYLILFAILCLGGICLSALQLPGNWLILLAAIGYDAWYHWQPFGPKWLIALGLIALAGEAAEFFSSAVAARRAGATRRAGLGALAGGILGMLIFSIPVPIVGTIAGGMIGCFIGAVVAEMTAHDDVSRSMKVGLFATIGRVIGLVAKLAATMAMAGAAVSLAAIAK